MRRGLLIQEPLTSQASSLRGHRVLLQPGSTTLFFRLQEPGYLRTIDVLNPKVWGLHKNGSISILHLSLLSGWIGLCLEPNPTRNEGFCLLSFFRTHKP